MATLPTWGPEYRVSLSFYVHSLIVPGMTVPYTELLSFTASEQLASIGYRIPAIFIGSGGGIGIGTQIGDNGNWWYGFPFSEETWYQLELTQFIESSTVNP